MIAEGVLNGAQRSKNADHIKSKRLPDKEPEQTRITIVEDDALSPLPGDHDVVLLANAIHLFSAVHNRELLQKIRATIAAGTHLLLVDLWTDPTHSQPLAAALMSGQFLLASGEGQSYSEQEADGWLQEAGWRKLDSKPTGRSNRRHCCRGDLGECGRTNALMAGGSELEKVESVGEFELKGIRLRNNKQSPGNSAPP